MMFKKLSTKLNAIIALIMVVIFTSVFVFISYEIYKTSIDEAENLVIAESKVYAKTIHERYLQNLQSAKDLETRISIALMANKFKDRDEVISILKETMLSNSNLFGVCVCFEPNAFDRKDAEYADTLYHDSTGRFIPYVSRYGTSFDVSPLEDYDKEESLWYSLPKKKNSMVLTEPFEYEVNDKTILMNTLSVPIRDLSGKFIGIIGLDTDITDFQKLAESMHIKGGFASIISAEGAYIAHGKNTDIIMKNLAELDDKNIEKIDRISKGEEFVMNTKSAETGENVMKVHVPISFSGTDISWSFVSEVPIRNILGSFYSVLGTLIIIAITAIILTLIIVAVFLKRVAINPLTLAVAHANEIAQYNITKNVPDVFLKRKDEIGLLSKSIQAIEDNLRVLVKQINNSAEQVAAASEELTAVSQQTATASEEVARTISEIAQGATEQAQSTTAGSEKLISLGNLIDENKAHLEDLSQASSSVGQLVDDGLKIISTLSNKTAESEKATIQVYNSIKKTNESSGKISEASSLITSIAQQTNLLALNAAIEAARAGENGRGFAVVADEIRKLAEQSTSSTKIIDSMVKTLQDDAAFAVRTMDEVKNILEEQISNVNVTKTKYTDIAEAIKASEKAVKIIGAAGVKMSKHKNEVHDTMQELSAVAEENAASTEEAAASMQEQSASFEEIANASEGLSHLAQELQAVIRKFQI